MSDAAIESAVERFISDVEGATATLSTQQYVEALRRVEAECVKRLQALGKDEDD